MLLVFYYMLLAVAALARGNENELYREEEGDKVKEPEIAESFDSPYYSPANYFRSGIVNGKSTYNVPDPILPSSYSAYPSNMWYGLPYAFSPYNRYAAAPYAVPPAYGNFLRNPAYMPALASGLGYPGYGGNYFGRSVYPGFGYGYPNYLPALSYPPVGIRGGAAPIVNAPAPINPAPLLSRSAPLPAVAPANIPGFVPSVARASYYRPVQSKDGTIKNAIPQTLY